jgi:hypothetical protein
VGGRITFAEVRFDLHDASGQQFPALSPYQHFAQQIAADPARVPIEEFGG